MPRHHVIILILILSTGCSEAVERDISATVQTDQDRYVLTRLPSKPGYRFYEFHVITRYTNPSNAPVYLARTFTDARNPDFLVDHDGDTSAFNGVLIDVVRNRQILVRPGETRVDTLRLSGPSVILSGSKTGEGELEGRMRVRFHTQSCPEQGVCDLGNFAATSNWFLVRKRHLW